MPPTDAPDVVTCPACGGANPVDAVFCGNPDCTYRRLNEIDAMLREVVARLDRS